MKQRVFFWCITCAHRPPKTTLGGILAALLAGVTGLTSVGAQPQPRDYTSKVPQFKFSTVLETQEAEVRTNALLRRMNESRRKMDADPHRPTYHYVNPEGNLNDPNGLCFWQGRWHLFYQAYPPEDSRQHWGHAVSTDLIHWRDLPLAIYPNPEHKVFSGATLVESNRVIAIYHGIAAGTMVAVSSDPLLLNWEKVSGQAVIPFPKEGEPPVPYHIFDPCIWKQGDNYYALTAGTSEKGPGGKGVRAHFLHRSKDLAHWEYLHEFIDGYDFSRVGDDGACPYFWPIGNRHILLHFSHLSGGHWLLGDYDTQRDKFVVTQGGDFNHGPARPCGVHAPSACPDGRGGVIAIFNMNEGKPAQGWNRIMTLPRHLTLIGKDQLGIEPAGDIESLRREHQRVGPLTLPANQEIVLDNIKGKAIELAAEIELQRIPMLELNVLRSPGKEEFTRIMFYRDRGFASRSKEFSGSATRFSIDTSYSSLLPDALSRAPETADVFIPQGQPLKLRVFVDRSVVEVFVNGRQCAAVRVYPSRADSVGISMRSQGKATTVLSLDAWQMQNIYDARR
ncbi:MAG: glycoside hydrolase family 32 protein [Verrucomicrobiota bacterium]